ncbi:MAG TPA: hypothetical protein VN229_02350 [Terriglobales bacterium]|nr:hypothetical protein [Terriglobales bacterium]
MHENFLSYIMIGLSRGLFPSTARSSCQFDEEAYLRREAAILRQEKRAAAERQRQSESAEPEPAAQRIVRPPAAPETDIAEPASRRPAAFWRRGVKVSDSCTGLAGSEPCRAA